MKFGLPAKETDDKDCRTGGRKICKAKKNSSAGSSPEGCIEQYVYHKAKISEQLCFRKNKNLEKSKHGFYCVTC